LKLLTELFEVDHLLEVHWLHERMHVRAPLIPSPVLSAIVGRPVLLKLDAVQPSGSFKIRGIGLHCSRLSASHVVNSSGGNAGLAVAYAASTLGKRATVVVSSLTPSYMIERLKSNGANVLVKGNDWSDADAEARRIAAEDPDAAYVSPFDHPDIWEGHGSLVHELKDDPLLADATPAAIIVSVGGGGLFLGVCHGLAEVGWNKSVKVIAAETKGADSFSESYKAGKLVTLEKITSIAKSLGARTVSTKCLDYIPPHENSKTIIPDVVSDFAAVDACARFADDHRLLVEPACGAALAVAYSNTEALRTVVDSAEAKAPIVVVVCGGNMATPAMLQEWKEHVSKSGSQ
jgi:L-serine/L-threonine ammonia-lyase